MPWAATLARTSVGIAATAEGSASKRCTVAAARTHRCVPTKRMTIGARSATESFTPRRLTIASPTISAAATPVCGRCHDEGRLSAIARMQVTTETATFSAASKTSATPETRATRSSTMCFAAV